MQAVGWCAIPFPQYRLPGADDDDGDDGGGRPENPHKVPVHGAARVQLNFWFFLFVYYGFYNLTALIWITMVFNIYSLNWWVSASHSLTYSLTLSSLSVCHSRLSS